MAAVCLILNHVHDFLCEICGCDVILGARSGPLDSSNAWQRGHRMYLGNFCNMDYGHYGAPARTHSP
uniref:Uncharacterized protein n=1 Tax=Medicago truncatula TaxID=3880 RepID=Q1S5J7_MEDTR|nr:hypothetical protein MtrDRAFT_AC147431g20v2 [Medicago truncatula]ABE88109.1 hypothetical protein MtrDRAFT_AC147431g64v2 [Medicago truncatula]